MKIFIKPNPKKARPSKERPGKAVRLVRDPATRKPLPAAGAWVERNSYWIRRLNDGDVVKAEPPRKQNAPANDFEQLVTAISQLDFNDEGVMTTGNKPDANVLGDRLNRRVTAKERDDAWAEYQRRQEATEDNQ